MLLIAALMPITPTKTGCERNLADHFFTGMGYYQESFVYFVFTNAVLVSIVGVGLVLCRWKGAGAAEKS